jgi:hypothetical protein
VAVIKANMRPPLDDRAHGAVGWGRLRRPFFAIARLALATGSGL